MVDGVNTVPFSFNAIVINLPPYFIPSPFPSNPLINQILGAGATLAYLLPLAVDPESFPVTISGTL
jgi:hypothetical protein